MFGKPHITLSSRVHTFVIFILTNQTLDLNLTWKRLYLIVWKAWVRLSMQYQSNYMSTTFSKYILSYLSRTILSCGVSVIGYEDFSYELHTYVTGTIQIKFCHSINLGLHPWYNNFDITRLCTLVTDSVQVVIILIYWKQ